MLAHGVNLDRDFVILYDEPGRFLEFGLATEDEPRVDGDAAYRYYDPEFETSVLGVLVAKTEKTLLYQDHLQLFVVPRDKALHTFLWEFPPKVVPGSEETKMVAAPILTDAYALATSGTVKDRAWVDLDFLPGQHDVSVMLPPFPLKCRLDDVLTDFQYDRPWHMARVHVTTPAAPSAPISLNAGEAWVEKFDPQSGDWLAGPLHALEDLGQVPYGYVKYRATFNFNGERGMFISTRADDAKKVFVNGKFVPEASNAEKLTDFPLANYAQAGANLVEISYELFGAPNFGDHLGELKGLESAGIGSDYPSAKGLENWHIQRHASIMQGRGIKPEAEPAPSAGSGRHHATSELRPAGETWAPATFLCGAESQAPVPAFTWGRVKFNLPSVDAAWKIPWKLIFDADCDGLIYLNGKFVGRYVTVGPQSEFYLPEPYLSAGGENSLTFVMAYTDHPHHLRKLQAAPYAEFSVRRTRIEFQW
jgi:hypothetical protein